MINADEFYLNEGALSVYAHRVSCSPEFMKIISKFHGVKVPLYIDERVISTVNQPIMLKVTKIAASILVDEISKGLPVTHISLELLTDIDAGRWEEIIFNVQVNLNSTEANASWDNILQRIFKIAEEKNNELRSALSEKIGIHFTWIASKSV